MGFRETWGLRLFLSGIALGLALMTFAVTMDATSFYASAIAPSASESTPFFGYVLDAGFLVSFAMSVAGIACFSSQPVEVPAPVHAPTRHATRRAERAQRRDGRRRLRPRLPSAPHGST